MNHTQSYATPPTPLEYPDPLWELSTPVSSQYGSFDRLMLEFLPDLLQHSAALRAGEGWTLSPLDTNFTLSARMLTEFKAEGRSHLYHHHGGTLTLSDGARTLLRGLGSGRIFDALAQEHFDAHGRVRAPLQSNLSGLGSRRDGEILIGLELGFNPANVFPVVTVSKNTSQT